MLSYIDKGGCLQESLTSEKLRTVVCVLRSPVRL